MASNSSPHPPPSAADHMSRTDGADGDFARRRGRGRARAVSGIAGTADRLQSATAIMALAPPSTDAIRKARQTAARRRALTACGACKESR